MTDVRQASQMGRRMGEACDEAAKGALGGAKLSRKVRWAGGRTVAATIGSRRRRAGRSSPGWSVVCLGSVVNDDGG
jgi:hypothetical protein